MSKQPKKKEASKPEEGLQCDECKLVFNSPAQAEQHFTGKKHLAIITALKKAQPIAVTPTPVNKQHFCEVCNIALNSDGQMLQHVKGLKHKLQAGVISEIPDWWHQQQEEFSVATAKRTSGKGVGETFRCDVCKLDLNSTVQFQNHMDGSKHKEKVDEQAVRNSIPRGRGRFRGGPPFLGNRPPFPGGQFMPPGMHRPMMMDDPWFGSGFGPMHHPPPRGFRPHHPYMSPRARGRGSRRGGRYW